MPSGLRSDSDMFIRELDEAKVLAQEIMQLIQDRNSARSASEASRKTAAARRKLGTLGTLIDKQLKAVDVANSQLSEQERNRRRDLLYDLRNLREQMQIAIRRTAAHSDREALLAGAADQQTGAPQETEATAALDTAGMVQLQRQMMAQQDQVLEQVEKGIKNVKHIALAIGEEADLQTRLLDDLDDQVDVAQTRLKAATLKVKQLMRNTSHWKGGLCIFVLIIMLVVVLVLAAKLVRFFG